MSRSSVTHAMVRKVHDGASEESPDLLAAEEPLEIRLGYGPAGERAQHRVSVTMRTPGHDLELALGFLFTEGIIHRPDQLTQIRHCTGAGTAENNDNIVRAELREDLDPGLDRLQRNFYTTSSCGICGKASIDAIRTECPLPDPTDNLHIGSRVLTGLTETLRNSQHVFGYTGGLHASALFDTEGKMLLLREDVGRHNALDKLIGAALGGNLFPLGNHVLLLSGRASFELLQKAAMAGIRIVCAVGAPSSLAVQMAEESRITLVGFLRDQRFNIYTQPQRIIIEQRP